MPPVELVAGLILYTSLGLGSSQALDASATKFKKSMAYSGFWLKNSPPHIFSNNCFMAGYIPS